MSKFAKNIFNDLIFMIRFIFNDKKTIFQLLLVSFIPIFIPIILIPLPNSLSMVIQFSLISCVAIIFGITTYNYRYSTLYENNKTTSNNSWTFYIAKYIFIIIISLIISMLLIAVLSFLNLFNILMFDLLGMPSDNEVFYSFSHLPWLAYFIVVIETVTLTFAISFFIKSLSKSIKSYYIIIFCLLILIIPFGGVINKYFEPLYIITPWDTENAMLVKTGMAFVSRTNTLVSRVLFIPSLIFPFYSTGVLFSTMGSHLSLQIDPNADYFNSTGEYFHSTRLGSSAVFQWYSVLDFDESWLQSYIDKNKIASPNFLWQYKLVELMPLIDVIVFGAIGAIISKLKTNH